MDGGSQVAVDVFFRERDGGVPVDGLFQDSGDIRGVFPLAEAGQVVRFLRAPGGVNQPGNSGQNGYGQQEDEIAYQGERRFSRTGFPGSPDLPDRRNAPRCFHVPAGRAGIPCRRCRSGGRLHCRSWVPWCGGGGGYGSLGNLENPERVFNEGVFAFLRFLAHIIEQGGVAGQVQQAHLPVAVGVQGCLQAAQGQRAVAEHLAAPGERFLLQVLQGNHGIDQAHVQRLPGIVLPAQVPDFPRFFWPTMRAR